MSEPDKNTAFPWEAEVAKKRQQRLESIPEAWKLDPALLEQLQTPWENSKHNFIELRLIQRSGILSEGELKITEAYDVAGLLKALASGQLTAVEVTTAFSKRAAIAQQLTNCLTEVFFQDALDRARQLDLQRRGGQLAGPLHGLPISLKDTFQVTGIPSTLGFISNLGHEAESNSTLVQILLRLGAVLYCKTNVPQTMMSPDSHNLVFGRTLNPWNTSLTPGGSSGGESALIALRGSPLGIGTDIAGSIRVPALCCGLYGFKPTAFRVPYQGQHICADKGLCPILPSAGPIANDMGALYFLMKIVLGVRPALYDASAPDVEWREVSGKLKPKLRLGLLPEDPTYPLHPPVRRALAEAVALIKAGGHQVIQLQPEQCRTADALQVAFAMFAMDDSAKKVLEAGGETRVPSLERLDQELGKVSRDFIADLDGLDRLKKLSGLNQKRREISEAWHRIWTTHEIDAFIGPVGRTTAVEHDEYTLPPYTVLLNLLDYPACSIPFGQVGEVDAAEPFELRPGQAGPTYNPANLAGAPCAIQVFTPQMQDEECLEISAIIDRCIKRRQ